MSLKKTLLRSSAGIALAAVVAARGEHCPVFAQAERVAEAHGDGDARLRRVPGDAAA